MAPMGIRLSPLGVAVFCLLALGVVYHLYAGVISSHIAAFSFTARGRTTVDLRDLLALSVEAAEQGGREVKRVREGNSLDEKTKGKTREGASEKLTQGDLHSHRKMYYLIKNTYPDLQVNSEEHDSPGGEVEAGVWSRDVPAEILQKVEGGREAPADSITVWIDPLDATQEYTENLVKYVTTMVCVAVGGKPTIGVIHNPFTGFTAWALVGEGSNVTPRPSYNLNAPRVVVSRSHAGAVKPFIEEAFGNNTVILPAGGAGYKVLSLLDLGEQQGGGGEAEQADLYLHVTFIKKWDICAGAALLAALGGHMTTLRGEEIDYRGPEEGNAGGLLASVGGDHAALVAKLPPWRNSQDKH